MADDTLVLAPVQIATTDDSTPYSPLREFEIRVLDLQVGDATDSSTVPLTGQLRVVNLNEKPEFTTLSYVWGEEPKFFEEVFCDGHSITVPRNCLLALQDLRGQFGSITIWVDSICINQSDEKEKLVQIPLMGQIYSRAHTGYIWLGEARNSFIPAAKEYIAKGGLPFSFLVGRNIDGIPSGYRMAVRLAIHLHRENTSMSNQYTHTKSLRDILQSEWIERLWTFQEVLLSQNSVLVCEEHSISWLSMIYMIEYISFLKSKGFLGDLTSMGSLSNWTRLKFLWLRQGRNGSVNGIPSLESRLKKHRKSLEVAWILFLILSPLLLYSLSPWGPISSLGYLSGPYWTVIMVLPFWLRDNVWIYVLRIWRLMAYDRKLRLGLPDQENEAIMIEIQTRKCGDPKDKYLGVLGVIDTQSSPAIVNNLESLGKTYQKLFCKVLNYTQSLELLLLSSGAPFDDAPSWVIDWRSASSRWMRSRYWAKCGWWVATPDWPRSSISQYAGATLASKSSWRFDTGGNLVVCGKPIATLTWCSPNMEKITDTSSWEVQPNVPTFEFAFAGLDFELQSRIARDLSRFVEIFSDIFEGPAWWSWCRIICGDSYALHTSTPLDNSVAISPTPQETQPIASLNEGLLIVKTPNNLLPAHRVSTKDGARLADPIMDKSVEEATAAENEISIEQRAPTVQKPVVEEKLLVPKAMVQTSVRRRKPPKPEVPPKPKHLQSPAIAQRSGIDRKPGQAANPLPNLTSHRQWWPPFFKASKFHQKLCNILAEEEMILSRCDEVSSPLGLAPKNAKEGDLVTLIAGVSMPVLLRLCHGGGYKFVGPMFLPGLMDGERWEGVCGDGLEELVLI